MRFASHFWEKEPRQVIGRQYDLKKTIQALKTGLNPSSINFCYPFDLEDLS